MNEPEWNGGNEKSVEFLLGNEDSIIKKVQQNTQIRIPEVQLKHKKN